MSEKQQEIKELKKIVLTVIAKAELMKKTAETKVEEIKANNTEHWGYNLWDLAYTDETGTIEHIDKITALLEQVIDEIRNFDEFYDGVLNELHNMI